MKFAVLNGNKVEATRGSKGICPSCGSELVAKCGERKINHWAHKGSRDCDPWWENETEWHRSWKSNFPEAWQEVIHTNQQTTEKHIADVKTEHGVVVEFQHSSISSKERISREQFYKNMIWVVDGTRLQRDYPRFCKGRKELRFTQTKGIFIVDFPDECFPSSWLQSSVPVIFDFRGLETIDDPKDLRQDLYCLLPKRNGSHTLLAILTRTLLIDSLINGKFQSNAASKSEKKLADLQKPSVIIRRPESPYYLERGRWKKRRRL